MMSRQGLPILRSFSGELDTSDAPACVANAAPFQIFLLQIAADVAAPVAPVEKGVD